MKWINWNLSRRGQPLVLKYGVKVVDNHKEVIKNKSLEYYTFYRIIDLYNQKSYVGYTSKKVFSRWCFHLFHEKNDFFHSEIRSVAPSNLAFKIEEILSAPAGSKNIKGFMDFIRLRELNFMDKYNCRSVGYNIML